MSKMQLNPSPLEVISQMFWEVSITGTPSSDHGPGDLAIERQVHPIPENPGQWRIVMQINLNSVKGENPPGYTGGITVEGRYKVHENYSQDPERLVRITGASMLYGAAREMITSITARAPHGMLTLPSVSFYENDGATPSTPKKVTRKKAKKKRKI